MAGREILISRFLKISGLFILCGWMFFLGILVGRGTSPVSFDTRSFQKKLAAIAGSDKKERKTGKKLDFDFYEMLQKPVTTGHKIFHKTDEIFPVDAGTQELKIHKQMGMEKIEIKKSKKAMTFSSPGDKPASSVSASSKSGSSEPGFFGSGSTISSYTIQIAAYRNLKDALNLIKSLEKRGYKPYRTMGRTGDQIWHRIRIGSFKNMALAEETGKKLKSAGIKGIIIQNSQ